MSIPIQLKFSTVTPVPSTLLPGEVAFYLTAGAVVGFVGDANGVPQRSVGSNIYLPLTGGTVTGAIKGIAPVGVDELTRKDYVDTAVAGRLTQGQGDARYLQLTGGSVSGQIIMTVAAPTLATHLTRKDYVDTQVAGRLTQGQGDLRYAPLVHTHIETGITDLNRTRWMGTWAAGTYAKNDIVTYLGYTYVATATTSATPPGTGWSLMGAAGSGIKFSDTAPSSPFIGDLWYRTTGSVGLYVYYNDGNSSQWISTDQSSSYYANMLQLAGGIMTGKLEIAPLPAIPVGLALTGVFATAAITIPSGESIALDTAGTVKMRFNSANNHIEFSRGGVVKSFIDLT